MSRTIKTSVNGRNAWLLEIPLIKKLRISIVALIAVVAIAGCAHKAKSPLHAICDAQVEVDDRIDNKLIVLEDLPGTNEAPQFVANLACTLASRGNAVLIGLEIPTQEQRFVDAYLDSEGTDADKRKLIVARFFSGWLRDGRNSEAVLNLIDSLRRYRKAGLAVAVLAFDSAEKGRQYREFANSDGTSPRQPGDDAMFRVVDEAIAKNPDSIKILLTDSSRVSRINLSPGQNTKSLAQMLSDKHRALTFSPLYLQGTNSSVCLAPYCQNGIWPLDRIAGPPTIRLHDDPRKYNGRGIDGAYFVGSGLTRSPSAVPALPYAEPNIE